MIAVERPGTGRLHEPPLLPHRGVRSDIEQLVDHLGVDRFAVTGLSGGGPYTLVGRHLPDRVVVASLLGGIGPVRGADAVFSYTRRCGSSPRRSRCCAPRRAPLRALVQVAEPFADPIFEAYARILGFADSPVLRNPQFRAMFLHDLLTAEDLRATAHDLALFARHWGFHLDEVDTPVIVWTGLADVIVPPSHGHHQAARLPRGELRIRPGEGHFAGFSAVADVLDRVREVWADRTDEPVATPSTGPTRRRNRPKPSD